MKILILTTNNIYLNPAQRIFYSALAETAGATITGIGFGESEQSISQKIADLSNEDVLICDTKILFWESIISHKKPFQNSVIYFSMAEYKKLVPLIKKQFLAFPGKKIYNMDRDAGKVDALSIDLIEKNDIFVMTMYGGCFRGSDYKSTENSRLRDKQAGVINRMNYWGVFANERPERVIPLPFSIPIYDIFPIGNRYNRHGFIVPGVEYPERLEAYKAISSRSNIAAYIHSARKKVRRRITRKSGVCGIAAYCSSYWANLRSTRAAFVSGGVFRTPVRKYFEVPAAGALMVAKPCVGMSRLGFVNGHNFLAVETERDLRAIKDNLWDEKYTAIADCGQELIRRKHTTTIRAEQALLCIKRVSEASYFGAEWNDAELLLRQS